MKFKIPPAPVKEPIHTVKDALDVLRAHGLYVKTLHYEGAYSPHDLPSIVVRMALEFAPGVDVVNTIKQLHDFATPPALKTKQW